MTEMEGGRERERGGGRSSESIHTNPLCTVKVYLKLISLQNKYTLKDRSDMIRQIHNIWYTYITTHSLLAMNHITIMCVSEYE